MLWPFLALGLLLLFRRQPYRIRKAALVLFVVLFIVSFALNVVWTNEASPWAFFSLPTRAWEFAAGGFLGTVAIRRTMNPVTLGVIGFIGFGLLVARTEFFDSATRYPGTNALIPVAATVLPILAGACGHPVLPFRHASSAFDPCSGPDAFRTPGICGIGRSSFSQLSPSNRVRPLRANIRRLGFSWRSVPSVPLCREPHPVCKTTVTTDLQDVHAWTRDHDRLLGVAAGPGSTPPREPQPRSPTCNTSPRRASSWVPHQERARWSPLLFWRGHLGSSTVALVGDSHSATWFNTISKAATQQHLRVLLLSNPGCP